MNTSPFLQSVVTPLGRFTEAGHNATVERIYGTAFIVTNDGMFMTARHVLEDAQADIAKHGGRLGVFPMTLCQGEKVSLTVPITCYEHAPTPYDISLVQTPYRARTFFRCLPLPVEVWQDVATMGYPVSAMHKIDGRYEIQQRAHKGYIQRKVPSGRLRVSSHPDLFEVNFAITHGLSGSPLFIHRGEYDLLIGVCVGSHASRVVDYETVTYKNEVETQRETILRVEEFGVAHDVRPLFSWAPQILSGMSLLERSEQSWKAADVGS